MEIETIKTKMQQISNEYTPIIETLFKDAEDQRELIERLQEEIKNNPVIVTIQNGGQQFKKPNPSISEYNKTYKTYQQTIKQITDIYKKAKAQNEVDFDDGFDDF